MKPVEAANSSKAVLSIPPGRFSTTLANISEVQIRTAGVFSNSTREAPTRM